MQRDLVSSNPSASSCDSEGEAFSTTVTELKTRLTVDMAAFAAYASKLMAGRVRKRGLETSASVKRKLILETTSVFGDAPRRLENRTLPTTQRCQNEFAPENRSGVSEFWLEFAGSPGSASHDGPNFQRCNRHQSESLAIGSG